MAYDNASGLIAMSVVFEVLAVGMVLLRFMSRRKMRAGFRADDWLICIAFLLGTGLTVIEIYGVVVEVYGYSELQSSRPMLERYYESLKLEFIFLLLNVSAVTFIKLSVVLLYCRLFTAKGSFGAITLAWTVFVTVWGITFFMWLVFQCGSHVSAVYTSYDAYTKYCEKNSSAGYALVYTDLLADLVTLFMPLPMVIKLHTSRSRKIVITAVFAIGVFTVAASATRTAIYTQARTSTGQDVYLTLTSLSVWNYLEVMVGICAACAVTIRPVFKDLNLSRYSSRLLSLQESDRSKVSHKRSTTRSSDATLADDVTPRLNRDYDKAGAVEAGSSDTDCSTHDEDTQRASDQGRITVERSYNVSVVHNDDDEISNTKINRETTFCV